MNLETKILICIIVLSISFLIKLFGTEYLKWHKRKKFYKGNNNESNN